MSVLKLSVHFKLIPVGKYKICIPLRPTHTSAAFIEEIARELKGAWLLYRVPTRKDMKGQTAKSSR